MNTEKTNDHPIVDMIDVAIKRISETVQSNAVIGEPILMENGTVILPICKASFGFASGGSDIPTSQPKDKFGGGAGAGVSLVPVGFLVCSGSDVKLLQISDSSNSVDRLIGMMPEVMDKVGELLKKEKAKKDEKKEEEI